MPHTSSVFSLYIGCYDDLMHLLLHFLVNYSLTKFEVFPITGCVICAICLIVTVCAALFLCCSATIITL